MADEHDKALLDRVAEAIYHAHCGLNCDGYRAAHGAPCKRWRTDAPWDSNPDELCEHERDDYRAEAQAAIDAFLAAQMPEQFAQRVTDMLAPPTLEPGAPQSFLPSKDSPFLSVLEPKK